MANVILICGKPGCGSFEYINKINKYNMAVVYNLDEFYQHFYGDVKVLDYDEGINRCLSMIYKLAADMIKKEFNVILNCNYYTRSQRDIAKCYFESLGAMCEIHYIKKSDSELFEYLDYRKTLILSGMLKTKEKIIDEEMFYTLTAKFEEPTIDEVDSLITEI